MHGCARLDRQVIRRAFFFTAVFFFCAHLYRFCTLGFTHDSLLIDQSQDTAFQLSLGRFMQPLYWMLRGDIVAPFLIGVLSCAFIALATSLILSILNILSPLSIMLISMTLTVNATLSVENATYIHSTDIYMFSFFLSVLSVYLFLRFKWGFFLSPFVLCVSLGLYQSYLQTAILLYLMVLVHKVLDKASVRSIFCIGIAMVAQLLAGLLLYAAIYPMVLKTFNIAVATTYNGLSSVGDYSNISIPALIKDAYLYPFRCALRPQTALPQLAASLYVLLFAITAIAITLIAHKHSLSTSSWGMLIFLIALMPLGSNIIYIISKGMIHILMSYSFFLFFVFPISLLERLVAEHHASSRAVSAILTIAFSALYLCNVTFANQLYLRRDLEMQSTLSLMSRVIDRIEQTEGYVPGETPVALLGSLLSSPLSMARPGFEHLSSLIGADNMYTVTSIEYYAYYYNHILGYPLKLVDSSRYNQISAYRDIQDMPVFPDNGCCQMIDGTLVVRLGG